VHHVSVLTVDTSVWVDFFRGDPLPDLEYALEQGLVVLPPLVCAELLSTPLPARRRAELASMLQDLPLHPTPFEHWADVGMLRAQLLRAGLRVSTPDAHIAQCAIDTGGALWSRDKIFRHVGQHCSLHLFRETS
jgi:predicted nucleic acid-binding protein